MRSRKKHNLSLFGHLTKKEVFKRQKKIGKGIQNGFGMNETSYRNFFF